MRKNALNAAEQVLRKRKRMTAFLRKTLYHFSVFYYRTKSKSINGSKNFEKIFSDEWIKRNVNVPHINNGLDILQELFICHPGEDPGDVPEREDLKTFLHGLRPATITYKIKPRERVIAATVIQWLGTNVGWGFLDDCLRKCGYMIVRKEDA
jgi:hypothetical protein